MVRDDFQSDSSLRMVGTAKAQVPSGIQKDKSLGKGETLSRNRQKGKNLIVPDEIK